MVNRETIQIKTRRGFTLNAFKANAITQEIQTKGEYEANTLSSIEHILEKINPETSLDVGANIGNHALVIARNSRKLIAFEPVKFIFDVLESNLKVNHVNNVQSFNCGLSNSAGLHDFFISSNGNFGSSSLEKSDIESEHSSIETVVGDDFIRHLNVQDIDFIKMDIEGHEAKAIQGLSEVIRKNQPLILLEWNNINTIETFKQLDLMHLILADYQPYSLSSTDNKKMYKRNLYHYFKRIYYKWFNRKWCLSNFDPNKTYTNVYMVPARYSQYFKSLKFIGANEQI